MFATRWQPFRLATTDWQRLQGEMERAFENVTGASVGHNRGTHWPALNMREQEDAFLVEAELPGMELEELEIYVNGDGQLTVKGERKAPASEGTWHRQERGFGSFSRTIQLPRDVDPDQVTAELKLGILTVTLPKKAEVKPRRIDVKGG